VKVPESISTEAFPSALNAQQGAETPQRAALRAPRGRMQGDATQTDAVAIVDGRDREPKLP